MSINRWLRCIGAAVGILAGVALIGLAVLPFDSLKAAFDLLKSNHHFKSLLPTNAIVFRAWLAGLGALALFLGLGMAFFKSGLPRLAAHARQVFTDARPFFASLRPQTSDRPWLAALAFIMVLGILFRLRFINQPFDHDEAYTFVAFASGSLRTTITDYHLINNHVFHSILVNLVTHAFGNAPWAVRLPAFTAAILCIPAAYALALKLYRSRETALLSALLVAWIPVITSYADNARGYTLVALFTLLIFWLGISVRQEKNHFAWLLLSLFSALGFYTIPIMIYPFGALFAWLFFTNLVEPPGAYGSRWNFLLYWLTAGFGAVLLMLVFYTPIFIISGPDSFFANAFVNALDTSSYLQTLQVRLADTWVEWTARIPLALVLILAAGLLLGLVFHRRLSVFRVPMQWVTLAWIAFVFAARRPEAWSKYWLFLIPLLMIWASAGLVFILDRIPWRPKYGLTPSRLALGLAVLLVLVTAIPNAAAMPASWAYQGAPEQATIFLGQQVQPNDLIVVLSPADAPIWYYSTRYGIPQAYYNDREDFNNLWVVVDLQREQTLDSVLKERGPDPAFYDRSSALLVKSISYLEIYYFPKH